MTKKNVLFIVEGINDEPNLIEKIFKIFFPNISHEIYSYKTNLHVIASNLENNFPDFEKDEIDIKLFFRSYEKDDEKKLVFDLTYTDIYMIFDFEPQEKQPNWQMISRMISYFNDSTDRGKLFINYPMMQSYKHFTKLPDEFFYKKVVDSYDYKKYKEIVGKESKYSDINSYDYTCIMSILIHHLMKANYILNGKFLIPYKDEYCSFSMEKLYQVQYDFYFEGYVSILNTSLFIVVDYQMTHIFKDINTHKNSFLIP